MLSEQRQLDGWYQFLAAATSALKFNLILTNEHLNVGIIVAGWDKHHGGEVYSIPLGGSIHKQPFAIGGILSLSLTLKPQ